MRRDRRDTISLKKSESCAIADVGEGWPSRSGRASIHGSHETGVIPRASEESRRGQLPSERTNFLVPRDDMVVWHDAVTRLDDGTE